MKKCHGVMMQLGRWGWHQGGPCSPSHTPRDLVQEES